MAVAQTAKRSAIVRFRLTEAEHDHVRQAARDAGFPNLSDFLRSAIRERHTVVVGARGVVLVPAVAGSVEEREAIEGLLTRLLTELSASSVPEAAFPDAPGAPPAPTSPGEGDGTVGTASHEPPADAGASQAAGSIPGSEETSPPTSDVVSAFDDPAAADAATGSLEGAAGESMTQAQVDAALAAVDPASLEPDPNPPLGPIPQAGENEVDFLTRRREELKRDGHPSIVAGYEAEAEWRKAAADTYPIPPGDPGLERPAVGAGPVVCRRCGATRQNAAFPCPDCGAS